MKGREYQRKAILVNATALSHKTIPLFHVVAFIFKILLFAARGFQDQESLKFREVLHSPEVANSGFDECELKPLRGVSIKQPKPIRVGGNG
jgi:hypothetical protein